jgi:hypothetical protein
MRSVNALRPDPYGPHTITFSLPLAFAFCFT